MDIIFSMTIHVNTSAMSLYNMTREEMKTFCTQRGILLSFIVLPLIFVTSAVQCRFWQRVGCCVLLRGVSFWSLGPIQLLWKERLFRSWVHQHGMISPLSCSS